MTSNIQLREADYQAGLKSEIVFNEILNNFFNYKFKMTSRYNLFDYISMDKNIYVEFKHRYINSDTYKSTMIGINKINYACDLITNNKKVYFFFKFNDCIMYYQFTKFIDEYISTGGRNDRHMNEIKHNGYYFIPYDKLLKL